MSYWSVTLQNTEKKQEGGSMHSLLLLSYFTHLKEVLKTYYSSILSWLQGL